MYVVTTTSGQINILTTIPITNSGPALTFVQKGTLSQCLSLREVINKNMQVQITDFNVTYQTNFTILNLQMSLISHISMWNICKNKSIQFRISRYNIMIMLTY